MSTATAVHVPYEHTWKRERRHYKESPTLLWVCVQVNCDGVHHFYRPCGER